MILTRVCSSEKGTFGVLTKDNIPLCVTCEDPWNDNERGISCIPEGTYNCIPHSGPQFKNVWLLENVPGRSAILIHAGNSIADTRGCILVGKYFIGPAIAESRLALQQLREKLPQTFTLTIRSI